MSKGILSTASERIIERFNRLVAQMAETNNELLAWMGEKEHVAHFDVPREFRPVGYWSPCEVIPDPADDPSNHHPLDPEGD